MALYTGVQMYLFDGDNPGPVPNNSILLTNNFGQIPHFQCISGTTQPSVGQWISPSAQDITTSSADPFSVIVGDQTDPGYLDISLNPGQFLTIRDQGVYSCWIPDETGINTSFSVGIYIPALSCKL